MSASAYHLLVADLAQASKHDLPTLMAAAEESRRGFYDLWQQHDLRHLLLKPTHDDANAVWDGFLGFLGRHISLGDPIAPLVMSASDLMFLKVSCANELPLLRPLDPYGGRPFPEVVEEMAVMASLHRIGAIHAEMTEHYTRLHHITAADNSDRVACVRSYLFDKWAGLLQQSEEGTP